MSKHKSNRSIPLDVFLKTVSVQILVGLCPVIFQHALMYTKIPSGREIPGAKNSIQNGPKSMPMTSPNTLTNAGKKNS